MNRIKTMMLLAALTALLLAIGQALGGRGGLMFALVFAGIMNLGSYWFSDKIVLRMYGAQPLSQADAPEIFSIVSGLAQRLNIPMPALYLIPQEAPNAFATGRNPTHAAVAVTEGIVKLLNRDELEGVLAHELSHVINRDTLVTTIAATLAGALSQLANMAMWGAMLGGGRSRDDDRGGNPLLAMVGIIVAPFVAMLLQMAISRSREFMADQSGAEITGHPLNLANALKKLEMWKARIPMNAGSPATASLFIVNPFSAEGMTRLFSTHPSTEERIRRLEEMAVKGPEIRRNF